MDAFPANRPTLLQSLIRSPHPQPLSHKGRGENHARPILTWIRALLLPLCTGAVVATTTAALADDKPGTATAEPKAADVKPAASDSIKAAKPSFTRTEDVIYGRKFGTALTMDVFRPEKQNGAAVIFAVSGGWFSAHEAINAGFLKEFLDRGYTVFAVVHGSQPKFTIPEILEDMHRSVRFIR